MAFKMTNPFKQQVLGGMRRTKSTKEQETQKTTQELRAERCRNNGGTWDPKTKKCIPLKRADLPTN